MAPRAAFAGLISVWALALAGAPAAHAAAAFDEVLKDYQSDGKIDPCAHSETTLRDAANQVPADIEQYAPDFPSALGKAVDKRTQDPCPGGRGGGTAPPATTAPTPPTTPPAGGATPPATTTPPAAGAPGAPGTPGAPPPATPAKRSASDSGTATEVYAAIAAGAVLLLAALTFALSRLLGWDGRRLAGVRHAWGEAGYRAGATWGDFRDWVRFGR